MNFRALAFLDTSYVTAALVTKYRDTWGQNTARQSFEGSPHHDTQSILLRGPQNPTVENWFEDIPQVDYPILKDWKSARAILARIKDAVQPLFPGRNIILGKAMIVRLKVGGHVDWHVDEGEYAEKHDRAHLCLLPSPGAFLYSGTEMAQPPVGSLTWINNRILHSAVNMGPVARVHLIADIRKPDQDDSV
jgi:hypothetical protein